MDSELRDVIKEAFVNEDYDALQGAIEGTDLFPNMTEEKFEEAIVRKAQWLRNNPERLENRKKINLAIENLDYDEWKSLAHKNILEIVNTEDKFFKLAEMHKHIESARKIREELWLPERPMNREINRNRNMNINRNNNVK